MEIPPIERKRRHARSIAKVSLAVSLITLSLAILFPFYCFLLVTINDEDNETVAATRSIVDSNWPLFTLPDTMTSEEKTRKVTSALLLNIVAFLVAAMHSFSAMLLLKGTEKNLKPNHAIELVRAHQRIQYVFHFTEASLLLASIFVTGIHDFVGVMGLEFLGIAFIFRNYYISTLDWFEIELANAISIDEKESEEKC